ncbi:hypothetical protein ACJROX_14635 [Pseudalkalibacillus sp. A8]|uniref:NucA/NucB deoxyribonuclease domain-containing protein n=1 Tax=Pseudalkalibacillus sp. A8 TaxID=3382641 RepID=UPI0038B60E23
MSEAKYQKLKAAGTLSASDWTKAVTSSDKGKQLTEAQANAQLRAADDNYGDTSKVPLQQGTGEVSAAAAVPPTSWGETPSKNGETCLENDAVNQRGGHTLNRWTWCHRMRIGLQYWEIKSNGERDYEGTNSLVAQAVAIGNGKQRGIRTYFRAEEGSVSYDDWDPWDRFFTAPDLHLYILSDCAQGSEYCHGTRSAVENTWSEWDYTDSWLYWDIFSHEEASTAVDKVLYHDWYFRFGGGEDDEYQGPEGKTDSWQIRCDSADYFSQFGVDYSKACVNYNVVPHLTYRISDDRVEAVARHIQFAQDNPTQTYPVELDGPKDIPGKYTGARDGRGLTRTPSGSVVDRANEDMKNRACQRKAPYFWRGLPPYDTSKYDCDEYPFSTTNEGASDLEWDFSVRAVPKSQNTAAGALLRWYYFSDRILYNRDPFWVNIQD